MRKLLLKGKLSQRIYTLVDDEDYERLNKFNWILKKSGTEGLVYAQTTFQLQRLILPCPKGKVVDHINGNGLDNRRSNLRIASKSQSVQNRRTSKNNTSGYKGVTWNKANKRWLAFIGGNKNRKYLGTFKDKEEAAMVYNLTANKIFGNFVRKESQKGKSNNRQEVNFAT